MGSRAAVGSAIALEGSPEGEMICGVICLAYPLHRPKDKVTLRSEPLQQLNWPCLFVSGTRDEMCDQTLMEDTVISMNTAPSMEWITGADHSYKVKGQKDTDTLEIVLDRVKSWVNGLSRSGPCQDKKLSADSQTNGQEGCHIKSTTQKRSTAAESTTQRGRKRNRTESGTRKSGRKTVK